MIQLGTLCFRIKIFFSWTEEYFGSLVGRRGLFLPLLEATLPLFSFYWWTEKDAVALVQCSLLHNLFGK